MSRSSHRDPTLERRWRRLLDLWKQSQQTIRRFCTDHHVSEASFYLWRREIARRDGDPARPTAAATPAAFVPVRVIPDAPIEVVLPSGVVVRMTSGGDPAVVARLVAALRATP